MLNTVIGNGSDELIDNLIRTFCEPKEDKIIINKLINNKLFINCECILLYLPLQNEVNTYELIDLALKNNKIVGLPKTYKNKIDFIKIEPQNWEKNLTRGMFNLLEPESGEIISSFSKNTIIVVPSIALGKDGSRIGHGKGYYDKFLENKKSISKIGICRDYLLFDKVPTTKNDIFLDLIISSNLP